MASATFIVIMSAGYGIRGVIKKRSKFLRESGWFQPISAETYPLKLESAPPSLWQPQISGKPNVCRTALLRPSAV